MTWLRMETTPRAISNETAGRQLSYKRVIIDPESSRRLGCKVETNS